MENPNDKLRHIRSNPNYASINGVVKMEPRYLPSFLLKLYMSLHSSFLSSLLSHHLQMCVYIHARAYTSVDHITQLLLVVCTQNASPNHTSTPTWNNTLPSSIQKITKRRSIRPTIWSYSEANVGGDRITAKCIGTSKVKHTTLCWRYSHPAYKLVWNTNETRQ